MNSVDHLLQKKFSAHSDQEKLEIKRLGRDKPELQIKQSDGKNSRKFSSSWYDKATWLTGSVSKQALYCFPCLLFGKFDDGPWTKSGFTDLKHLSERIRKHEGTKSHINCCVQLELFGKLDIRNQLDDGYRLSIRRFNMRVDNNRHVLSRLIDAIKFCGKFELALRGRDESKDSDNPGIYRGLIDLMAELDNVLADHLKTATVFKGTSKTIQNELLDCMYEVYLDKVKAEINAANFVSIQADETTDVACKCQLVIILRYLVNGEIKERFLGFHEAKEKTAKAITNIIKDQIQGYDLTEKLISQTYDGASTMKGCHGGVQKLMRETYPHAHFVHCYAHQLNLIMQQACTNQVASIKVFFANLSAFPAFFSGATKRVAVLKKCCKRRLPRCGETRWNFNSRTVCSVYENREALIECLTMIKHGENFTSDENDLNQKEEEHFKWDQKTINEASGLLKWLEDEEFMFFLNFFHRVMPHVEVLYDVLQSREISIDMVRKALDTFTTSINNIRRDLSKTSQAESTQDDSVPSTSKRRKMTASQMRSACIEACDIINVQAKERFSSTGNLIPLQLVDPALFSKYRAAFPINKLNTLTQYYPMISKEKLRTQLEVLYSNEEWHEAQSSLTLLEFVRENNLYNAFSEIYRLLEITVTTPLTSAESERCFSTLKRILTFLRNTMTNDRLNALAMLSIHGNFVRQSQNFNELVIEKFVHLKNRRAEFLYKTIPGGREVRN